MDQRAKTIKPLEENTGGNLHSIGHDNDLDMPLKVQATKEKTNWTSSKFLCVCWMTVWTE